MVLIKVPPLTLVCNHYTFKVALTLLEIVSTPSLGQDTKEE